MQKEQAKIIKMDITIKDAGGDTIKNSCGGQGCRVYILPFIEVRPWDGNRRETVRKAA